MSSFRGTGQIPAIIDEALFNKVQKLIKKKRDRRLRIKPSKYEFLCKGLIRCVRCGRIYGTKLQKGYQLYACPQRRMVSFNEPPCRSRTMSRRKIDTIVWGYTKGLIKNYDVVNKNIAMIQAKRSVDITANQKIHESLVGERDLIKSKKSKLLELYSEAESDTVKNDIKDKLKEFDERSKSTESQISEIAKQLATFEDSKAVEEEIKRLCTIYRKKVNNPGYKLRELITRKWVSEINILDNGALRLKVRVPDGEPFEELKNDIVKQNIPCTKRVANR